MFRITMKLNDLFEEWNDSHQIRDEDILRKLRRKIRATQEEIELLHGQLRDWDTGEGKYNITPGQKFRIQNKINSLRTYQLKLNDDRLAALKKYKIFRHDPEAAYQYAQSVRKGAFPEGEAAIAKNGQFAIDYALNIIHRRFPEGEEAMRDISVSPDQKVQYFGRFGVNLKDRETYGHHQNSIHPIYYNK